MLPEILEIKKLSLVYFLCNGPKGTGNTEDLSTYDTTSLNPLCKKKFRTQDFFVRYFSRIWK